MSGKCGCNGGFTLTVAQVIAELQKFPSDMPVKLAWEGLHVRIEPEDFTVHQSELGVWVEVDASQY